MSTTGTTPTRPAATSRDAVPDSPRKPPEAAVVLGVPLALAAVVALVLLAFGLPAVKAAPHDLPVGVTGPAAATSQVTGALAERRPGAFAVRSYADEAALTEAIRDREVYGGIVPSPSGPVVLTASAASPAAAQTLTGLAGGLAQQSGAAPTVRDIVPLPEEDARGAGLAAAAFPLVIGAIAPAFLLTRLTSRRRVQVAAGAVYAVVAGFAFAAVVHHWFGTLGGSYVAESAVFAATVAAGVFALLGLNRVLGTAGLGLGAATLVFLGNPLSGASSAPEFLASPWREIGQAMPPGAGSQVLRSVSFFDGAGAMPGWLVIGAWVLAGLALLALPARRARTEG